MNVIVKEPPEKLPVSVELAKKQMRVEHDVDDALIEEHIRGVVAELDGPDGWLGRALMRQTLELRIAGFPADGRIVLPYPPLKEVVSVRYRDPNGEEQTLSADDYRVIKAATPGLVRLKPEKAWPATDGEPDAVVVEYVAGYGQAQDSSVPARIRQYILIMVAHWYENRESSVIGTIATDTPHTQNMLANFKVRGVG